MHVMRLAVVHTRTLFVRHSLYSDAAARRLCDSSFPWRHVIHTFFTLSVLFVNVGGVWAWAAEGRTAMRAHVFGYVNIKVVEMVLEPGFAHLVNTARLAGDDPGTNPSR